MRDCRTAAVLSVVSLALMLGCEAEKPPAAAAVETATAAPSTLPIATSMPAKVDDGPKDEKEREDDVADPAAGIECKPGPNADFHDKGLEEEVRRKLQKPEGEIKLAELRKIKSINLARDPKSQVDYLDPCVFPHLTSVKDLFLGAGKLKDITALAKLTQLESLRISMNRVEDLSPLEGLKKLDRLDLGHTLVTDVAPLAGLTSLTELQLDNTKVTDVAPLAGLTKLERLSLQRTEVKDLSPLKPLKDLKFLYIAGSRVEDPYAIARPGLKVIQD